MRHKRFNGSLTRSCVDCLSAMLIWMTCSLQALREEHQDHFQAFLAQLQKHGVIIKPAKCILGKEELEFLGHHMDSNGISPLESKVQDIHDFPKPASQSKLREFLGLVNFYHRFVPGGAAILAPLNCMLSSDQHCAAPLDWSPTAEAAFNNIKEPLANASLLAHSKARCPHIHHH